MASHADEVITEPTELLFRFKHEMFANPEPDDFPEGGGVPGVQNNLLPYALGKKKCSL